MKNFSQFSCFQAFSYKTSAHCVAYARQTNPIQSQWALFYNNFPWPQYPKAPVLFKSPQPTLVLFFFGYTCKLNKKG